ncbi:MAG TPA: MlaD family protein [Burkholderiales bacterium]|nr:MlaD family protein [Burkholderiales bacterium]
MEAKFSYAAVGLFVLILGAALIGGILWLSSGSSTRKVYDTYYTYMDESVSGLSPDAPVRYRGVEVGRVRRIALAPENIEQVQLTMAIEQGTPVRVDTVAVLRTQGLTGIGYIELTKGRQDSAPLRPRPGDKYPVIRSGPSLLVRLEAGVTEVLANVNRSSEHFNALTDEGNRRALAQVLADLATASHALAARSADIDAGLANAARAMQNTARLTEEMSGLVRRVERSADAFDRMSSSVAKAGANVDGTLGDVRAEARQFAAETLPEVQLLVAELRDLTGSMRRFSEQLERNPSVLLYGKSPPKRAPGE